ncbi:cytochrome P450 [Actinomadura atramentaria]|uniref:cytochrome P450 n=1 Tax=Actinomadura atramentaria TaxID=1990 RepID=UPI00037A03F4|nr:cytochrome P450 [Actinomadura atramentaria]
MNTTIRRSSIDLYTDEAVLAPYGPYRELRDLGPAVWLEAHEVWAVARYDDVYAALHDHETFASGTGVGLSEDLNKVMAGSTIASDPPYHDHIRSVVGRPLTPRALRKHREDVQRRADELVDRLVALGEFDGVTDFAQAFPLGLVPDLLGWPEEGREHFLAWAAAGFNALGPMNERATAGFADLQGMLGYLNEMSVPGRLCPGSWGAQLVDAAGDGTITREILPTLLGDYLTPSLDTTIATLSSALWLLGTHPEAFDALRADPGLIPNAFNEVIRVESPVRGFSRLLTEDHEIGGVKLPEGSRALLLYASANRDERRWANPEVFDVRRADAAGHVGFGHGVHGCVGQGLARLEGHSLLGALVRKVRRIEVGDAVWRPHNTIHGIAKLPAVFHAA